MVRSYLVEYLLAYASVAATFVSAQSPSPESIIQRRSSPACKTSENRDISAPKENLWTALSRDEQSQLATFVQGWLNSTGSDSRRNASTGWNGTQTGNTTDSFRSISLIDILAPNKTDAVAYLSGKSPAPPRYAQLVIDSDEALEKYSIGPLPLSEKTRVTPMSWDSTQPRGGSKVPKRRERNLADAMDFVKRLTSGMDDILLDLVGAVRLTSHRLANHAKFV
jgi:primary-amine oxidase